MALYEAETVLVNPVGTRSGLSTEHAAAVVVLTALAFLIAIRRGFSGVSVGGVGVSVR